LGIRSRRTPREPPTTTGSGAGATGFHGIRDRAHGGRRALHVRRDDPPGGAAAGDLREVHALVRRDLLRQRRRLAPACRRLGRGRRRRRRRRLRLGRRGAGRRRLRAAPPAGFAAAVSIAAIAAPTFCSAPDFTLTRSTPAARAHLQRRLVALDVDEHLVRLDPVAVLLVPLPRVTSVMDSPGLGTTMSTMSVSVLVRGVRHPSRVSAPFSPRPFAAGA
jgi:hypothetical protein